MRREANATRRRRDTRANQRDCRTSLRREARKRHDATAAQRERDGDDDDDDADGEDGDDDDDATADIKWHTEACLHPWSGSDHRSGPSVGWYSRTTHSILVSIGIRCSVLRIYMVAMLRFM